jgi:hypothetical protein
VPVDSTQIEADRTQNNPQSEEPVNGKKRKKSIKYLGRF